MDEWWRGGVLYQVYPRSFQDSNGDGVGDLPGILERLPYIADLGVDALWISPFYRSPMRDFGYDIEDYEAVDPLFGTLEDFDSVVTEAHALGLRVMIDLVPSHTSDRHLWFQESRRSRDNSKADWYVWAESRADGTPPTNWLSLFGGPAWTWDPRREQYYLHNFLSSQPDLNLHNVEVQDAILGAVRFWLERGVDGFRIDACNFIMHDLELRDNPPRPVGAPPTEAARENNPYNRQMHVFDKSHPDAMRFLQRLRGLANEYPERCLMAEIADDDGPARMMEYTGSTADDGSIGPLHTAYSFALLGEHFDGDVVRAAVEHFFEQPGQGWPSWAFSNHDVARAITRWGTAEAHPDVPKILIALLTTLRGTPVLYQGEELGLPEADVPYERIVDPYGLTFFPDFKGRDGCRTPMPWTDFDPHAGFSTVEGWLPIPNDHIERAVAAQEVDQTSVLTFTRAFLRWRKTQPVLFNGVMEFVDAPSDMLVFIRRPAAGIGDSNHDTHGIIAAFNFGHAAVSARFDEVEITELLDAPGQRGNLLRAEGPGDDPTTSPIIGLRVPGNAMLFARVI